MLSEAGGRKCALNSVLPLTGSQLLDHGFSNPKKIGAQHACCLASGEFHRRSSVRSYFQGQGTGKGLWPEETFSRSN